MKHYARVRQELHQRTHELARYASRQYLGKAKLSLAQWVEAGNSGRLRWGIYSFRL